MDKWEKRTRLLEARSVFASGVLLGRHDTAVEDAMGKPEPVGRESPVWRQGYQAALADVRREVKRDEAFFRSASEAGAGAIAEMRVAALVSVRHITSRLGLEMKQHKRRRKT